MPKKGAQIVCRFKRGLGKKEGDGAFEEGLISYGHYVLTLPLQLKLQTKELNIHVNIFQTIFEMKVVVQYKS